MRALRVVVLCVFTAAVGAAENGPEVLEITADTTLDPQRTYGAIVVKKSGVTIDGRGAWLIGTKEGNPKEFTGVAISAAGVSNVTLKNVNAKAWETGLKIADGSGWHVENCNFSDNFHDPKFGWGENGRRGGMVLERVHKSTFNKNNANKVWDGCVLVDSDDNTLEENDFSRTSNTCLKLWHSCRNTVRRNNLSYGLRIDPGEVHARDSTSVLIESGSNDNRFIENDCTHGGDGIFVRVLNQHQRKRPRLAGRQPHRDALRKRREIPAADSEGGSSERATVQRGPRRVVLLRRAAGGGRKMATRRGRTIDGELSLDRRRFVGRPAAADVDRRVGARVN